MYVIARTATRNPTINGATLYLSTSGLWTLHARAARKFSSRVAADDARGAVKKSLRASVRKQEAAQSAE